MEALSYLIGLGAGVAILVKSADWFTDAAVDLARRFRIPEIVIGATLVSLATTLPEFAVSFMATLQGQPDMAIGNALGSTICNIGLILGVCALVAPMQVRREGFLSNGIALVTFAGVFGVMGYAFPDGSRVVGIVMLACLGAHLAGTLRASLQGRSKADEERAVEAAVATVHRMALLFIVGAAGIILGSKVMVYCGEHLARLMGVSELVIALTLVALGTSTPELAVSVAGVLKKRRSLAIGNIIGANILDLAWVIGVCSIIRPLPMRETILWGRSVHQSLVFDIPVMLLLSALLLVFGFTDERLTRREGAVLFAVYAAYITTLFVLFSPAGG